MNKIRRKSLQEIIDQLEELKSSLEELTEEEEEYRDNMPENLQDFDHNTRPGAKIEFMYPYNLFFLLFSGCDGVNYSSFTQDNMDQFEIELEGLSEREKQVVMARFKECKTLSEIAKDMGLSKERIRQIEHKAVRKLRNPRTLDHIITGKTGVDMQFTLKEKRQDYETELKRQRAEALMSVNLATARTRSDLVRMLKTVDAQLGIVVDYGEALVEQKFGTTEKSLALRIEEMDFSVRTYNCLVRGGYRDLLDLENATEEDLVKIRNLGIHSLTEIKDKLAEHGVFLKASADVQEA